MKSTYFLIVLLIALVLALGYNFVAQPFAERFESNQPPQPVASSSAVVSDPAAEILATLTAKQIVAQMFFVPIVVDEDEGILGSKSLDASASAATVISANSRIDLGGEMVGGVTLFGQNIATTSAQTAITQLKVEGKNFSPDLGLLIAVDHEGGAVQRLSGEGYTQLPTWQELCNGEAGWRAAALRATAAELKTTGIDIVFAPVVDVSQTRNALGARICSGMVEKVVEISSEAIEIYQQAGIIPVIKHFPGIGKVVPDLHTSFARVTITAEDAAVFRDILTAYPAIGVMTTHVGVTNQYPDVPCSLSSSCVSELKSSFPKTLVFSDALDMDSAGFIADDSTTTKSLQQRSVEAVAAGNHVLVYGTGVTHQDLEASYVAVLERYQTDAAFKKAIDTAVKKILTFKLEQGVE